MITQNTINIISLADAWLPVDSSYRGFSYTVHGHFDKKIVMMSDAIYPPPYNPRLTLFVKYTDANYINAIHNIGIDSVSFWNTAVFALKLVFMTNN